MHMVPRCILDLTVDHSFTFKTVPKRRFDFLNMFGAIGCQHLADGFVENDLSIEILNLNIDCRFYCLDIVINSNNRTISFSKYSQVRVQALSPIL